MSQYVFFIALALDPGRASAVVSAVARLADWQIVHTRYQKQLDCARVYGRHSPDVYTGLTVHGSITLLLGILAVLVILIFILADL
jgi:hypothetical protein